MPNLRQVQLGPATWALDIGERGAKRANEQTLGARVGRRRGQIDLRRSSAKENKKMEA